jgi:positive regulator of sigma E activity
MKNNFLVKQNPEIFEEWDFEKNILITPYNITCGANKKVFWKCKKGHSWNATVYDRCRKDNATGCPYCKNKKVCEDNCLSFINPNLANEWNFEKNGILKPNLVTPNSDKSVWWRCKKGHEWIAKVNNRNNNKSGCPYCSGNKVCEDNCLDKVSPELAAEWNHKKNITTPKDVTFCSSLKVWWKCYYGHEWESSIANRQWGNGCPFCSGKIKIKTGEIFDSFVEAYLYLILKERGIDVEIHKKYGLKKFQCDFYIPKYNTFIEVTSFNKEMTGKRKSIWPNYYEKILAKKKYVEETLRATFIFMQFKMNNRRKMKVIENTFQGD